MIVPSPIPAPRPERLASHRFVETNGIRLHVAEAGGGEPIVFLHGFPENWFAWRKQFEALSLLSRTLAVDLRGYGISDAPPEGYDADTFAADLLGLLDALGIDKVNLVGHDWGGLLMWRFAFAHPGRVRKIATLNTPHLLAGEHLIGWPTAKVLRALPRHPAFAYVALFRTPELPERLLSLDPERFLRECYRATSYKGRLSLSEGELRYLANLYSRPGAWRGPLAYYRNAPLSARQSRGDRDRKLDVPVLALLGRDDPLLRPKLIEPMRAQLTDLTVHQVPECGHWPHLEQPGEVNKALARFFGVV